VAHSWGFHALDTEWKSTTTLLKSLINNVSLNGNFMLNIGPRANGDVPYEISQRMLEMGKWLSVNGEAIYGAEAINLDKSLHDWGKITCKRRGSKTKLYLHVFNWPLSKKLNLTGISTSPEKVYLLADKQQKPLSFDHSGVFTQIELPVIGPDSYTSVVVVEYSKYPETEQILVAKTTDGGYSLTPRNLLSSTDGLNIQPKSRRGTVPEHALITGSQMKWKIYVDEPGSKTVDVSYSFQGKNTNGKLVIRIEENVLTHEIVPSGKTVGEPNSDWVIDNFKSYHLGNISFPEKGFYEIEIKLNSDKNEEVKFQWIWVK
jgi:alpha-L-fucosidase